MRLSASFRDHDAARKPKQLPTPAVEHRHKYLNRQHIIIRKNPCFVLYTTESLAGLLSVTSGLRMIQPAKPASPIRLLYEQLPKVHVFSAHKNIHDFLCSFFHWNWSMCSDYCLREPKWPCVSLSWEVGITFLILRYSKEK